MDSEDSFGQFIQGKIGEDAASLLGAMLITKQVLTALSRQDVRKKKKVSIFVDEFRVLPPLLADILSGPEVSLNLVLATNTSTK